MPANYNKIARIYDLLSSLVFGDRIQKAQVDLIKYIPPDSDVLIVGGGTGRILEKIAERYPRGLTIDYVEVSSEMMILSRKRDRRMNRVNFIQLSIEDFVFAKQYDVIITPFILDNFKGDKLETVFKKLDAGLKDDGLWLYTDFLYDKRNSPIWQKLLLKIMYLFFRISSNIETMELINVKPFFAKSYLLEFEQYYYFKFIRSAVYRKEKMQ